MGDQFCEAVQDTNGGGSNIIRCVGALFSDMIQLLSLTPVDSEFQVPLRVPNCLYLQVGFFTWLVEYCPVFQ